ncbi:MAG: hypothetical protein FJY80_09930 [Candidatus Aminicenantes bacterium]|nr:hypothetical protein [Candidatus Aminicenantes bacterium]
MPGRKPRTERADDLGLGRLPLCLEPWQSYYILRRGIMPCCYGNPVLAPMAEFGPMWNSPELQEIRSYLARGELSPYCHQSQGCPIVQRVLAKKANEPPPPPPRPAALRAVNRLFFRLPGRLWRAFGGRRNEKP